MITKASLYEISCIYKGTPAKWLETINKLQNEVSFRAEHNRPLMEGIFAELANAGTGKAAILEGIAKLEEKNRKGLDTTEAKSLKAFGNFCKWQKSKGYTLNQRLWRSGENGTPVVWNGFTLKGGFHAVMENKAGEKCLVYFYRSEWKESQIKAFVELLTIVAEIRHNSGRSKILFVDLNAGKSNKPSSSFKQIRKDLQGVLQLLMRISDKPDSMVGKTLMHISAPINALPVRSVH